MHLLLKSLEGRVINMVTTLLESYSIALESVSDLNHRVLKENRELRAENTRAREYIAQVEKENDSLKYEHTMFHAREWFNNNPKCDKVYVFVLDADGVNDDGWIADSHAVVSINDGNCVGSYDRNTNE